MSRRTADAVVALLLASLAAMFGIVFLRLPGMWWYQDDPLQFAVVQDIANPVAIFLDPRVMRGFGAGHALVPMQILSYWLDVRLFGAVPSWAYAHSILALAWAAVAVYALMRRLTHDVAASVGTALIWLILPTTISVACFISARHYMEGMALACITTIVALRTPEQSPLSRIATVVSAAALGAAAMLFKEVFAVWVPVVLVAAGIDRKRHERTALGVLFAGGYAVYRIIVAGPGIEYTMPFVGARGAARYVLDLPFTLCVGDSGKLLALGTLAVIVWAARKDSARTFRGAALLAALGIMVVAATYPVMFAVNRTFATPGTWYRAPFAADTCIVMLLGFALSVVGVRWATIGGLGFALLLVLPGTNATRDLWQRNLILDKAEGQFYLANPDKLLYSQEEANWFIPGVHKLYRVPREHYIRQTKRDPSRDGRVAARYATIWRYDGHGFRPDAALYASLTGPNSLPSAGTGRVAAGPRGSSRSRERAR